MLSRITFDIVVKSQPFNCGSSNPFLNTFSQSVRWKRKPIWFPVAKSKLFRIPERKVIPEDEKRELRRLHNIYRTQCKAIRRFLYEEHITSIKESPANENIKLDDEDSSYSLKLNEEWNKEVAGIRELRLAQQAKAERDKNLEHMLLADQEARDQIKLIDSIVKEEKAKSSSYITPENLDEAIEHALANPVDHNFAIDLEGNIYHGRTVNPEVVQEGNEQSAAATQP